MIVRMWHGVTPAAQADAYLGYLETTGVQEYRATPGNLGVQILRRLEDQDAHFLLVTQWESWEAIRRFAGDDVERAVYYPEDQGYLLELEPHVTHYEVVGTYGLHAIPKSGDTDEEDHTGGDAGGATGKTTGQGDTRA